MRPRSTLPRRSRAPLLNHSKLTPAAAAAAASPPPLLTIPLCVYQSAPAKISSGDDDFNDDDDDDADGIGMSTGGSALLLAQTAGHGSRASNSSPSSSPLSKAVAASHDKQLSSTYDAGDGSGGSGSRLRPSKASSNSNIRSSSNSGDGRRGEKPAQSFFGRSERREPQPQRHNASSSSPLSRKTRGAGVSGKLQRRPNVHKSDNDFDRSHASRGGRRSNTSPSPHYGQEMAERAGTSGGGAGHTTAGPAMVGGIPLTLPFLQTPQAKRVYRLLNRKLPAQSEFGSGGEPSSSRGDSSAANSEVRGAWLDNNDDGMTKKGRLANGGGGGTNGTDLAAKLAPATGTGLGKQHLFDTENDAGGRGSHDGSPGPASDLGPGQRPVRTNHLRTASSQPSMRSMGPGLRNSTLAIYGGGGRGAGGKHRQSKRKKEGLSNRRATAGVQLPSLDHEPVVRPRSVDKHEPQSVSRLDPLDAEPRQSVSQEAGGRQRPLLDKLDARAQSNTNAVGPHGSLREDWLRAKDAEAAQQQRAHREIQSQLRGIPIEFLQQYREAHGTVVEGRPAGLSVTLHGLEEDMVRNALQRVGKILRRLRKAQTKRAWFLWRRHTKHQRRLANESSAAESARRFALNVFLRLGRRFDRGRLQRRLRRWHKLAMRAKAREERAAAILIQKSYRAAKAVGAVEWQRRLVLYREFHRHKREVKVLYFAFMAAKHRARRRSRLHEDRRRWHQRFVMHLAAIRLQKAFHGFRGRRHARLRAFLYSVARVIQRNVRHFLWRLKNKDIWAEARKIAPRIQKTIRGLWARRKARLRWQAREEWRAKQDRVQRNWHRVMRRYVAQRQLAGAQRRHEHALLRRRMRLRTESALRIQKVARGYVARRQVQGRLPEERRLATVYAEVVSFLTRMWRREQERRWWRAHYQLRRTAMVRRAKLAQGQNRKWRRTYPEIYLRNFGDVMERRPEALCLWEVIKMEHVVLVVGPELAALAIQGLVRRVQAMLLKEAMLRYRTQPFARRIQVAWRQYVVRQALARRKRLARQIQQLGRVLTPWMSLATKPSLARQMRDEWSPKPALYLTDAQDSVGASRAEKNVRYEHGSWVLTSAAAPPGPVKIGDGSRRSGAISNFVTDSKRWPQVSRGRWYFEVVVRTAGRVLVGWADNHFGLRMRDAQQDTGDDLGPSDDWQDSRMPTLADSALDAGTDTHSWVWDGRARRAYHNGEYQPWGVRWKVGDTIGCQLDCEKGEITFTRNGVPMGAQQSGDGIPAFQGIAFETQAGGHSGLRPVVAIVEGQQEVKVNVGRSQELHGQRYTVARFVFVQIKHCGFRSLKSFFQELLYLAQSKCPCAPCRG